jgi:hypothetical protein
VGHRRKMLAAIGKLTEIAVECGTSYCATRGIEPIVPHERIFATAVAGCRVRSLSGGSVPPTKGAPLLSPSQGGVFAF